MRCSRRCRRFRTTGSHAQPRGAAIACVLCVTRIVVHGTSVEAVEVPIPTVLSTRAMARAGQSTRPVLRMPDVSHRVILTALEERLAELDLEPDALAVALRASQELTSRSRMPPRRS